MPDPLVSILIPCYKAEPWLVQTWARSEIIDIGVGSTDGSTCRTVLHHYVANSKRWYFRETWRRAVTVPSATAPGFL